MALPIVPYSGPIVTRAEAKAKELKRYFMGPDRPCKYGHVSERTTVDGGCIMCSRTSSMDQGELERKRAYSLKYDKQHRAEKNAKTAERYQRLKADLGDDGMRERFRAYYWNHRETALKHKNLYNQRHAEKLKAHRSQPAVKERIAETGRVWAKANPERAAERQERYRQAYPEKGPAYRAANKEKLAATRNAWRKANPEMVRANVRKWHAANPGAVAKWRKANPEAYRAQVQTRHALMANAEGKHTAADLKLLMKEQKGRCVYCQTDIRAKYSVDHIKALSRGGSNWISNIQLLCQPCNSSKQDADAIDFARRIGRLL